MRKRPKNTIAQLRMTTLATNALLTQWQRGKKNRNRVINNKSKKKIQQEIYTAKSGKLIEKAKDVHLIRLTIKKKIRAKANMM